jgi:hypothetical protein
VTTSGSGSCTATGGNRTVTVCTPAAESTVASPVSVTAAATDSSAVSVMQLYLDGAKVYETTNSKQLSTSLSPAAGTHRLTVQAKDSAGYFNSTLYFTIGSASSPPSSESPCTLSQVNPSVTICTPDNYASVSSPVHVFAGSTDSHPVQKMELWADGVKKYQASGGTLDTYVSLASGTRRIVVQGYDSVGAIFKQVIYVEVQ